jgi:hypothetical protein
MNLLCSEVKTIFALKFDSSDSDNGLTLFAALSKQRYEKSDTVKVIAAPYLKSIFS